MVYNLNVKEIERTAGCVKQLAKWPTSRTLIVGEKKGEEIKKTVVTW